MSETEKSLLVSEEENINALRQKWIRLRRRAKRSLNAAREKITGMAEGDFVEKTRKQLVDVKGKAGNKISAAVRSVRIAVPEGLALGRRIIGR